MTIAIWGIEMSENKYWLLTWAILSPAVIVLILGTDGCRERDQKIRMRCIEVIQSPERCK